MRAHEVSLKENSYWLTNVAARIENGEDPRGLLGYADLIKALSRDKLQAAAQKYLAGANVARFVLLPENGRVQ